MRTILIATAALAVGGFFASSPASAQQGSPPYVAGGPQQVAGWCLVDTDDRGDSSYGYYQPCGGGALASEPRRSRRHR
jgi:hypothetical protein